jgi:hypothetical protein
MVGHRRGTLPTIAHHREIGHHVILAEERVRRAFIITDGLESRDYVRIFFPAVPFMLLFTAAGVSCELQPQPEPFLFHAGPVTLRPSGFFEGIVMERTATTGDTVNTRFGRIPVQPTPSETLLSAGHSRIQVCAQAGTLSVYIETDFLDAPGRDPFRFRQYWGEYRIGKWRILGGQAWSLLRPNRLGINSESRLMNPMVVEPAYHVGLAGVRNRQLRITREDGNWRVAATYEAGKSFLGKVAHDGKRLHLEAIGLGSVHRRAASAAAVIHTPLKIDIVTQQVISRGVGPDLLDTIPPDVNAHSTIGGAEVRVRPTLELFVYGGIAHGGRSSGNRTVRQWTAGFIRHMFEQQPWGAASLSAQFSQVDRATWPGGHGNLNYVQISFRYSMPGSRSMFAARDRHAARPTGRP